MKLGNIMYSVDNKMKGQLAKGDIDTNCLDVRIGNNDIKQVVYVDNDLHIRYLSKYLDVGTTPIGYVVSAPCDIDYGEDFNYTKITSTSTFSMQFEFKLLSTNDCSVMQNWCSSATYPSEKLGWKLDIVNQRLQVTVYDDTTYYQSSWNYTFQTNVWYKVKIQQIKTGQGLALYVNNYDESAIPIMPQRFTSFQRGGSDSVSRTIRINADSNLSFRNSLIIYGTKNGNKQVQHICTFVLTDTPAHIDNKYVYTSATMRTTDYANSELRLLSRDDVYADRLVTNNFWHSRSPFYYDADNRLPNCTCYAYGRAWQTWGVPPTGCTGNAKTWWSENPSQWGGTKSRTPAPGDIVVWGGGSYGHVAFVEEVQASGLIKISESRYRRTTQDGNYSTYNETGYYNHNDYYYNVMSLNPEASGFGPLLGYLHPPVGTTFTTANYQLTTNTALTPEYKSEWKIFTLE